MRGWGFPEGSTLPEGDKSAGMKRMSGRGSGHTRMNRLNVVSGIFELWLLERFGLRPLRLSSAGCPSVGKRPYYTCSSVFTCTLVGEQLQDSVAGLGAVISLLVTREVAVRGKARKHVVGQSVGLSCVLLTCSWFGPHDQMIQFHIIATVCV